MLQGFQAPVPPEAIRRPMSLDDAHELAARINGEQPVGTWRAYAILARDMANPAHASYVVIATHVPCHCEYVVEFPAQWSLSLRLHADV